MSVLWLSLKSSLHRVLTRPDQPVVMLSLPLNHETKRRIETPQSYQICSFDFYNSVSFASTYIHCVVKCTYLYQCHIFGKTDLLNIMGQPCFP